VFAGPVIDLLDDRRDYGETRWLTYGLLRGRMVAVVWTARGDCRHVISMRKPMSAKSKPLNSAWVDPDDAPELTAELARRGRLSIDGKVVREATGTFTKPGRPPAGNETKQQVTLRLPPAVVRHFKAGGPGWQTRISEVLERYARKGP